MNTKIAPSTRVMSDAGNWQPTSSKDRLLARAALLREVRDFFYQRAVLEVETPVMSRATGSDPNLEPVTASCQTDFQQEQFYLQTSPEFAMKRLLAAGSGPIFQICKAFRSGERGLRHNPEFTMLEWYRPGFSEHDLMDEVMSLVQKLFPQDQWQRLSYQQVFEQFLGINPHTTSPENLAQLAHETLAIEFTDVNKDTWLDLLFSHLIEPQLLTPLFIYDFPASQAALARVEENTDGHVIARRFELVMGGMEIANGYLELTDPVVQQQRFLQDQQTRSLQQKVVHPLDENLLAALAEGLPDCSGVALGLDRLLMLICGAASINEVLAFPLDRA